MTVAVFEATPVAATGPVIEIAPVVLFCAPAVAPVTVTGITQLAPPAKVPAVNASVLPPVIVIVPPQVDDVPFAAVKPAGKVSLNAIPLIAVAALVLVTVKFIVVVPPTAILLATKAFAIVGAVAIVSVAVFETTPVKAAGPLAVGALLVLLYVPDALAVTFTVTVQEVPEVSVSPDTVMPTSPAFSAPAPLSVSVEPVQLFVTVVFASVIAPGVVGNTSVTLIPVTLPGFAAGFVIVKVSVVLPPLAIVAAPNAFDMVGGV